MLAPVALCACFAKPPPPTGTTDAPPRDAPADATADAAPDAPRDGHPGSGAFVQTNGNKVGSGGDSVSVAFPGPVTAGDLIVLAADWDGSTTAAFADSDGDTFLPVRSQTDGNVTQALFYASATGSGTLGMSVELVGSAENFLELRALEYAGLSALDTSATGSGELSAAGAIPTPQLTTTGDAETLITFVLGSEAVVTPGSGEHADSNFEDDLVEDAPAPVAGTYAAAAALDKSGHWDVITSAFR